MSNREYWNNRGYAKKPLPSGAKLAARIKNGEFEVSYYKKLIERENAKFDKLKASIRKVFKGNDREWLEVISPYSKKHHRIVQDLERRMLHDEKVRLNELRQALKHEFGQDWWDELIAECDGAMELYELYLKKSKEDDTKTD